MHSRPMQGSAYGSVPPAHPALAPFAAAIRKDAVLAVVIAVLGIPISLACVGAIVKETIALGHPPMGLMTLVLGALAAGCAYNTCRWLSPANLRLLRSPETSPLYQLVMTQPQSVREIGGVVGRRNVIRMRLADDTVHTLHVGREDVEPCVRLLFQWCPYARPFQGP